MKKDMPQKNKEFLKKYLLPAFAGILCAVFVSFSPVFGGITNRVFQKKTVAVKKDSPKTDEESYGQGGFETPSRNSLENIDQGEVPDEDLILNAEFEELMNDSQDYKDLTYHVYRIKKGDMLGFLAKDFGLTTDTLISVNNIKQSRLILPGQYLKIPSLSGILYTVRKNGETAVSIADKYDVNHEKLTAVNHLKNDSVLKAGETIFVPDALLDWVTRQEINGDLFVKPLHSWYYFSSPFGWRESPFTGRRSFHNGVDMACNQGTVIYPALSGTVTTVGYSTVYGNYVIVTHHSGYKTLYAHMNKTNAWRGRWVSTSSAIGYVGNTGMSTGSHLHFSIFKNGVPVNPLILWK